MNKEWSESNKIIQMQLKKEATFTQGIQTLLGLRQSLADVLYSFKEELSREDYNSIPFINANGYHNKTIAYSIWHIFRIEDIVAHTLIKGDEQIFFSGNYQEYTSSPIITTGNELEKQQIADFSRKLNIEKLYTYMADVKESTDDLLRNMSYADSKRKITDKEKEHLKTLHVVSTDEKAFWLIDYWCGKDIKGLIQMPFSRH
ncbi:MAG: phage head-tail adapter protein [Eubacteriales bacterium]|nr:phage head-tail adapter protein [Eubacteriales bacterium]